MLAVIVSHTARHPRAQAARKFQPATQRRLQIVCGLRDELPGCEVGAKVRVCCNVSILRLFGIRRLAAVGRSPHTRLFYCHVTGSFSTQQHTANASDTMRLASLPSLLAACRSALLSSCRWRDLCGRRRGEMSVSGRSRSQEQVIPGSDGSEILPIHLIS